LLEFCLEPHGNLYMVCSFVHYNVDCCRRIWSLVWDVECADPVKEIIGIAGLHRLHEQVRDI